MIRSARQSAGAWRHVLLTLAMLAVGLKIAVPPGFMAATSGGLPFAVVLCTGQGMVTVEAGGKLPGHHDKAPADVPHDPPCAFAGHGVAAPPPSLEEAGRARFVAYEAPAPRTAPALAPGRGLSAPPPARAPPSLLS